MYEQTQGEVYAIPFVFPYISIEGCEVYVKYPAHIEHILN
jgi:hypothetical protein